ncbi:hypothetical protein CLU79DRAFT_741273 [Phycomyces nitens]|nr:hypothetical protein CLU79DRAFT_741273 [Phycomyces nitens]
MMLTIINCRSKYLGNLASFFLMVEQTQAHVIHLQKVYILYLRLKGRNYWYIWAQFSYYYFLNKVPCVVLSELVRFGGNDTYG